MDMRITPSVLSAIRFAVWTCEKISSVSAIWNYFKNTSHPIGGFIYFQLPYEVVELFFLDIHELNQKRFTQSLKQMADSVVSAVKMRQNDKLLIFAYSTKQVQRHQSIR